MPFYTAKYPINGILRDLYYFTSEADAASFQKTHGGSILQTSPSPRIWRVAV